MLGGAVVAAAVHRVPAQYSLHAAHTQRETVKHGEGGTTSTSQRRTVDNHPFPWPRQRSSRSAQQASTLGTTTTTGSLHTNRQHKHDALARPHQALTANCLGDAGATWHSSPQHRVVRSLRVHSRQPSLQHTRHQTQHAHAGETRALRRRRDALDSQKHKRVEVVGSQTRLGSPG
jgi:hypothetical protein